MKTKISFGMDNVVWEACAGEVIDGGEWIHSKVSPAFLSRAGVFIVNDDCVIGMATWDKGSERFKG